MEDSIAKAKSIAEDILSFFGLNVEVDASIDDDVITINVPSTHLNAYLIGRGGETLMAIQTLISNMLRAQNYEYPRVSFDVAEYKAGRQARLVEEITSDIKKVRDEKVEIALKPMNAADRRAVHKEVAEYSSVESVSEGEGRDRHIVLRPTADDE